MYGPKHGLLSGFAPNVLQAGREREVMICPSAGRAVTTLLTARKIVRARSAIMMVVWCFEKCEDGDNNLV